MAISCIVCFGGNNNSSVVVGKKIVMLGIPRAAHILAVNRGSHYIMPVGSCRLQAHDKLLVLVEDETTLKAIYDILQIKLPS